MEFEFIDGADVTEVDKKSAELIEEFRTHVSEVQTASAELKDERLIFEAWAIQKIAGLQIAVLKLLDQMNKLAARKA